MEQVRVYKPLNTYISLTHCGMLLCRSALHSAVNLSPWVMTNIRYSGNSAPSVNGINSHLEQTVRILVEHTDIDMSGESSEGDTFLNLAMNSPLGRLVVGRLSRNIITEFDLDHRNAQGKTLLMQEASNTTGIAEWSNVTKNLRALGADLDAKVLEKPDTSPRDIGATALHFAAASCLEKARHLLSQGANPHAISSSGHTATDRVLQVESIAQFLRWRRILLELGFDMQAFVRAEIDVHADLLWYGSNGCDEFVLGLFGFKPNFNSATGAIEFLPLSVAKALDNIVQAYDIVQAQDCHLTPAEEMYTFDL